MPFHFLLGTLLVSGTLVVSSATAGTFESSVQPLLKSHCVGCHNGEDLQGELDLERFSSMDAIRTEPAVWQQVLRQVSDREMPPQGEPALTENERKTLMDWVEATLDQIALDSAGDPGPVVLRRLSNHEYTYTIRDLTGVSALQPAKEFPIDGAAGEGFTNVGSALVMSPALLTKYLDAAKAVAEHAVILPERIGFSPSTSRADWTQEKLDAIRNIYARYAAAGDSNAQNLQGVQFSTVDAGVIPLESYLRALHSGDNSGLSKKYLGILARALNDEEPSLLLDPIRRSWRDRQPDQIPAIAKKISDWQQGLWHFGKVGHIGKRDGPTAWQIPVLPLATSQTVKLKLPNPEADHATLYLVAGDAGDGNDGDVVVWKEAQLVYPTQRAIPLGQLGSVLETAAAMQQTELAKTAEYLDAVAASFHSRQPLDTIATERGLLPAFADAWASMVQLSLAPRNPTDHLRGPLSNVGGYDSIIGWGEGLPTVLANRSDTDLAFSTLQVPARGVTVHPTPEIDSVVHWKSPLSGSVVIDGLVADMDRVCGNGAAWSIDLVNAFGSQRLAEGQYANGGRNEFGPLPPTSVRIGDLIKLTVTSVDRDHTCDTTQIALTIREQGGEARSWNLAEEVVDRLHEGNPLADTKGNPDVWHFCQGTDRTPTHAIPAESALGQWRMKVLEGNDGDANAVQQAVLNPNEAMDRIVHDRIVALRGPLPWLEMALSANPVGEGVPEIEQSAPSILEFRIPRELAADAELIATVQLHADAGPEGSVQALATIQTPDPALPLVPGRLIEAADAPGTSWTAGAAPVVSDRPILVREGSEAGKRIAEDIQEFQAVFPAALCYSRIVPVDEVVTLTLRYREDDRLQQLMLDDQESEQLDRLWDELWFVSRHALQQLDAYNQLWQYATQDADPSAFEPMREPIQQAAAQFEQRRVALEPKQLEATLGFAEQAWRRPLGEDEKESLRTLYQQLREQDLDHEAALRQLISRILVAPSFLYRGESAGPGREAVPVKDWELATRLSYFLWSSCPDAELRSLAEAGRLHEPDVLLQQTHRMLRDEKIRRLATEFGCQWLQVRDLESLDEKSERHFPTFVDLRDDMQEEITRFFIDLFQQNRSVLSLIDADHTFVNAALAEHYGLAAASDSWVRVDGLREHGRGGVLGFAGTLAKQSGASRTSPILRGNWISETLLGERLPRPPKDVPILPDEPPQGLTERELIEQHSSVPQCARCHEKIDPLGFALEGFDAIGRARDDANTLAKLADGTTFDGIDGLRSYLRDARRKDFLQQFARKLLGYAVGRSVQLSDKPLLDQIIVELERNDNRIHIAIESIVQSPQFRNIRGRDLTADSPSTDEP